MNTPGGSVPRWAGARGRGIAIRCDKERTRGWLGRGPQPRCRRFGGAPPACQRSGCRRIAWVNNTESRARVRGRKVPEWSHPLAPDSRRWRAVGRRALRAIGNISADSAGLSRADGPVPPWRRIRQGYQTPAQLNGLNRPGPPWIGAGGARRGLLAWQARLASFPLHYPWIVDAQRAMLRGQLANILKNVW